MKFFGILSVALMILSSSPSFALEKVECLNDDNQLSVSFELENLTLTHLRFFSREAVIKEVDSVEATHTRFLGTDIYETALGSVAYFDFERNKNDPEFSGSFLLGNNPFRRDTAVNCHVK